MKCEECGREIKNAHYVNGKAYGHNCYKKQLAILYKAWEDEKNKEYSVKCFSAMQVFQNKKGNRFHDSICKQWNDCKKLTAKQLDCIIKGFNDKEKIDFYLIWCSLTNDDTLKMSIPSWIQGIVRNYKDYIENELFIDCMLCEREYQKYGFHFLHDIEDEPETIFIMKNGKEGKILKEHQEDEYLEILKVVEAR